MDDFTRGQVDALNAVLNSINDDIAHFSTGLSPLATEIALKLLQMEAARIQRAIDTIAVATLSKNDLQS